MHLSASGAAMSPLALLNVAGAVLALVTLLAAAVVVARSSAKLKAAEVWRDEAEAYKSRSERLDEELAELRTRVTEQDAKIATLTELVTSAQAVTHLTQLVQAQHVEVLAALTAAAVTRP